MTAGRTAGHYSGGPARPGSAMWTREPEFFIGTVEMLDGYIDIDHRRAGDVEMAIQGADGESRRVLAILDADQYAVALRAHARGDAKVRIYGVLGHSGCIEPVYGLQMICNDGPAGPP
ncbi:MAG: hypothetical protein HC927_00935 [Deltaproteobacteria bacterium]|nr:hypothetical protein [Deltaproteobacteria bacterium]